MEVLRLNGARRRDPAVDAWLATREGFLGALAADLVAMVRDAVPDSLELMHDGWATFCVGDAPFVYVAVHKAHVSVGFYNGARISDPAAVLEGTGVRMRHVKLRPGRALSDNVLRSMIVESADEMRAAGA